MQQPAPYMPAGQLPAQAASSGFDLRRVYAEWYAWARTRVSDTARCHASAEAAVDALQRGQPIVVVTEMAAKVADGAPSVAPTVPDGIRWYANWFSWANLHLKLDQVRSHQVADAATQAQTQGAEPPAAADIGLQAVGMRAQKLGASHAGAVNRGALFSIGWGALCLVVAVVAPLAFSYVVLPFAPVFGLIWGWRVIQRSRQPLVFVAMGVNALALVISAGIFFLLHA